MHALRYAWDEAIASLWRGRASGLLSTATIALALFVLGGFLLVTANLQRLGAEWSRTAEMSVYLDDATSGPDRQAIEKLLRPSEVVSTYQYVSKADALVRFKQTFGELSGTIDSEADNPLPSSFEIRLKTAFAQDGVERLATMLRQMPGVADVRYDRQWLSRLLSAIAIIRGVGFGLGALLAIAAALTVANVVRLALHARRDEIDIMQLVGAPQAYIRGPFVMEGLLQGGLGALVALLVLAVAFFALRAHYLVPLASAINLSSITFLPPGLAVSLLLGGMAVGCIGGLVAAWNR
jgi:cell division transport system permease protein